MKIPLRFDGDPKPEAAGASPKAWNIPVMGPTAGRGVGDEGTKPGCGGSVLSIVGGSVPEGGWDADAGGATPPVLLAMKTWLHLEQRTRMGPLASLSSPTLNRV